MGYWIYQRASRFFLTHHYHQVALAATKSLTGSYSWVNTTHVLAAETLPEAFDAWRWHPELDRDGNITNIYHNGWKIGEYDTFFEAIAPWVEVGSFVRIEGKDGWLGHFAFDGLHARYLLERPGTERTGPIGPALGAHMTFVTLLPGLAERLAAPATVQIADHHVTPADVVTLARTDLEAARVWLKTLLGRRAQGDDPGDRALRVAMQALPKLSDVLDPASWQWQDLVMLVADAWVARLQEAALAGTPERTAALGAQIAPLMDQPHLAPIWTDLVIQHLCSSAHHLRLAAANVIANLGAAAPVDACTALLSEPHAAGVRIAVLLALQPHYARVAPDTILPALDDADATVQLFALDLFELMGDRAPSNLQEILAQGQYRDALGMQSFRRYRVSPSRSSLRPTTREAALDLRDDQDRLHAVHIATLPDNGVSDAQLIALDPPGIAAICMLQRPGVVLPPALIPVLGHLHPRAPDGPTIVAWLRTQQDRAVFAALFDLVEQAPAEADAPDTTLHVPVVIETLIAVREVIPDDLVLPLLDADRPIVRATALRVLGDRLPPERLSAALHDPAEVTRQAALRVAETHPTWDDLTALAELARTSTGFFQAQTLRVLGRFGPQIDLTLLAEFLTADAPPLKTFAAQHLAYRHEPASLDLLWATFQESGEHGIWLSAALHERAGELTADQVAQLPVEEIETWERVQRAASRAITDPAAQNLLLRTLFGTVDAAIWLDETAQALANLAETQPEVLARVAEMVVSPLPTRRAAAVAVLRFLPTDMATSLLVQALAREEHPDWGIIAAIRDRQIPLPATALIPALRTHVDEAREHIAVLLGQTGAPQAVEPLLASLLLPGCYGHEGAERALLALKQQLTIAQITELAASPSSWQWCMAMTLAGARSDVPQDILLAGLDDPATRRAALAALANRGEPFPLAPVVACATDTDVWVRVPAARALAVLGEACPPEPLLSLLGDASEWTHVAETAREALARVPAARHLAGPAALDYLHTYQPGAWIGIRSRCRTTTALASLVRDDPAAWEDLEASLRWPHWQVRLVALHAIREALTGTTASSEQGKTMPEDRPQHLVPQAIVQAVATLRDAAEPSAIRRAATRTLDVLLGCGFGER